MSPNLTRAPPKPRALYEHGIPVYTEHKGLLDLESHVRVMDKGGIDVSILSSGHGMIGDLKSATIANRGLAKICDENKEGRFKFLVHAAPLEGSASQAEVKKWLDGCPGAVLPSAFGSIGLDDKRMEPLYNLLESKGKYLFVHPAIKTNATEAKQYNAFDLYRTVGREFSLVMATMRLICGGVLDNHPDLNIVMSHLGGGISSVVPRIANFQNKEMWGIPDDPIHGRTAKEPFEHYLKKMYFDTGGFFGDPRAVQIALKVIPRNRILLGTDFPQEIRDEKPVVRLVKELRAEKLEANGNELLRD
jgi:predicted TIM-barrel fold metal-dependent hydrolase